MRDKLTPTEQYLAYLIGLGIAIAIIALLLAGLGTIENSDITNSLLIIGLAMVVLGVGAWLYLIKPWEKYDDLKTPAFTGHAEAHAEEEHAPEAAVVAEKAEPKPAPVVAAKPAPAPAPAKAEPKPAPAPEPKAAKPAAKPEPAPEKAPAAPKPAAAPDDLTQIEGVGPKVAAALKDSGITTFAQMAAMTPEDLEAAVKGKGVRLVGSTETWPAQARQAAGDEVAEVAEAAVVEDETQEDELTLIEGIGPKTEAALKALGVKTFKQVAALSAADLEEKVKGKGVRLVGSTETWPAQAKLAAAGKMSELEDFKARIKSGSLQD